MVSKPLTLNLPKGIFSTKNFKTTPSFKSHPVKSKLSTANSIYILKITKNMKIKIVRRLARSMNGVEHRKEKISFVINSMCAYASQKKEKKLLRLCDCILKSFRLLLDALYKRLDLIVRNVFPLSRSRFYLRRGSSSKKNKIHSRFNFNTF